MKLSNTYLSLLVEKRNYPILLNRIIIYLYACLSITTSFAMFFIIFS